MKRNPWIEHKSETKEEMERYIQEFLDNGGEIINTDNYSEKKNSKSAVKLGKVHRQLRKIKKKK